MSNRDKEEEVAETWLREHGYTAKRPSLPKGIRNPDFFAVSNTVVPPKLWAEVKSIDQDDTTAVLANINGLVLATKIPLGVKGHAMLNVQPSAVEQSVRAVLKLFESKVDKYSDQNVILGFVQQGRGGTDITRVEISADVPVIIWVRGAGQDALKPPLRVCDDVTLAKARIIRNDGTSREGKVYEFFEWNGDAECDLVARLDPADAPLTSISSMSGGETQTRGRTFRVIEDANHQIKTACAIDPVPGITFLIPKASLCDEMMITAALYGKLTVPINLSSGRIVSGQMYHGRDGAFRQDKNRHVSAAIFIARHGDAIFFPNPYAISPIPEDAAIFRGARRASVNFE